MRTITLLLIPVFIAVSSIAQNVGIGTTSPGTKLTVAGGIASTPVSAAAAPSVTIPSNASIFYLTAVSGTRTDALTMATPTAGQYLTIYNLDGNPATFAGYTIAASTGVMTFQYINGSWQGVSDNSFIGGGNYIKNQTAQQSSSNFNISGNGVIGGTLGVTGNTTLSGTEGVTGLATLSGGLTETGAAAINNSGAATTNIGVSGTGVVNIGNSTGKVLVPYLSTAGIVTNAATGQLGTTATVPVANGGTALSTAPANGQLLIGNGSGYSLNTITGGTGISVSNSAGGISITNSSPSSLASPTGTIGLTVVNGSATTGMRSDAAPALSQAIVPTWTGMHTFSNATNAAFFTGGPVGIGNASPGANLLNVSTTSASTASTGEGINLVAQTGGSGYNGGSVTIDAGQGGAASVCCPSGGSVSITAGAGGSSGSYGTTGGNVNIAANGSSYCSSCGLSGGNVNIYSGGPTASGTTLTNGNINFYSGQTSGYQTQVMQIYGASNYVGIGVTSPTYILQVNGKPAANGYTAWTNYSDRRLKRDIDPIGSSLSKIMQLKPVQFYYNAEYMNIYNDTTMLSRLMKGFIAQDVKEVFPEMVGTTLIGGKEYYDLNLSNLQVYMVKAMQEQQAIIEDQQKAIEKLKSQNGQVQSQNTRMQSDIDKLKASVETLQQIIGSKAEK